MWWGKIACCLMHCDSRSPAISITKGCFSAMVVFLDVNSSDQRRTLQDFKLRLFFSLVKLPKLVDAKGGNYSLPVCCEFWGGWESWCSVWKGMMHRALGAGFCSCSGAPWLHDIGKLLSGMSSKKEGFGQTKKASQCLLSIKNMKYHYVEFHSWYLRMGKTDQ